MFSYVAVRHSMITIDIHPNLFAGDLGGTLVVSWHGFFTFVAVTVGVILVGRWAPTRGIESDAIYSVAIWAIIGGIVGARLVHVIDNWEIYQDDPAQILAVWAGGIGLWGGILGGFVGGAGYAYIKKYPIGTIADLTAPVLPFAQSIGRIGDIINGEHCAKPLEKFFAMRWTNPDSPAINCASGGAADHDFVHPVIVYEILWNTLAFAVIWLLRGRLKPDGMLFAAYLALYAVGRFAITFFREDRVWAFGMQEAHYIALVVLAVTIPLLLVRTRLVSKSETIGEDAWGTRAERRRKGR